MKELVGIIKSLLEGLDFRRRWFAIVIFFALALAVLLGFEYFTGFNYYRSLEKKVKLLKELHTLAQDDIAQNQDLNRVYQETIEELSSRKVSSLTLPSVVFASSVTFWKAVSGASIWALFAILALFGVFGREKKAAGTIILGIVAILFGYLGTIIPTIHNPLVNYFAFPVIQLAILLLLGSKMGKS
jgi:hypothetical protein